LRKIKETIMAEVMDYPMTRQGIRNLDSPIRRKVPYVNVGEGERAASAIGGTVLAGAGLACGGMKGLLLVAVGGALVYRGLSGHCAGYAAVGMNTTEK
jgi:uncharacterized membrane protein